MSLPDKTYKEFQNIVPNEGQCVSLSGDNDSLHCPSLGFQTIESLKEAGSILERVHARLLEQDIAIPE